MWMRRLIFFRVNSIGLDLLGVDLAEDLLGVDLAEDLPRVDRVVVGGHSGKFYGVPRWGRALGGTGGWGCPPGLRA